MKHISLLFLLSCLFPPLMAQNAIDLSGDWGIEYTDNRQNIVKTTIRLPGSMLTNGLGNDVTVETKWVGSLYDSSYFHNPAMERYRAEGDMKFPFFLTPKKHFVGMAKYTRRVFIPKEWKRRSVLLSLERPHIESTVFVNGKKAGHNMSLSVAHEVDITPFVRFGEENEILLNIYNGIENVCVGQDSHSVTDQTQGDWNGVAGSIQLLSRPKERITQIQIFPDIQRKSVRVELCANVKKAKTLKKAHIKINRLSPTAQPIQLSTFNIQLSPDGRATLNIDIPAEQFRLWDEFTPALYTFEIEAFGETLTETFGMREISARGREMLINGRPLYIRGTVGNCCFPETGYPPTDEASWLAIFRKCKEYGLNMMRFHSYCPPEAAFSAADKVGFYLQPEGPSWPNHGVKFGNGMSIDRYLLEETQKMVEQYGNHPSFCMLAAGNEPAGNWVKWVGDFVDYWHSTGDNRRLYCGASVGGGWAFDPKSDYHVKGGARGLNWDKQAPQSLDDYSSAVRQFVQKGRTPITFDINEPYLSHEQGQWCAFPDFKEIPQYTGAYKAANFEIFRDLLADGGMASQAEKFLMASGKLQTLAYKYELERHLRTPEYTGFQLLALNDYSGQGTALVGVLNVHWREKGYCTAKEWGEFCAPVVPLAKFPAFVFTAETLPEIAVTAYNATTGALRNARVTYSITDSQGAKIVDNAALATTDIAIGKDLPLGKINLRAVKALMEKGDTAAQALSPKHTLRVCINDSISNSWDFWVYPQVNDELLVISDKLGAAPSKDSAKASAKTQKGKAAKGKDAERSPFNSQLSTFNFLIADSLTAEALETLKSGGTVLLTAAGRVTMGDDVKQNYLPVFWNTSWFKMRPPHTTGAYIDTAHPLFRRFASDEWANLNWWELLNRALVINLQDFPAAYQPPIQPIDTWHVSRKLGMMAEANIEGGGRILITTMDITSDLAHRPVAYQMRKALTDYIASPDFAPSITLPLQTIADLYTKRAKPVNMFTNESPDELKPKLK